MRRNGVLLVVVVVVALGVGATGCGAAAATTPGGPAEAQGCARTSVGLTPLTQPGSWSYNGQPGGLYPGGTNAAPASHQATGRALASTIEPRDRDGVPDAGGRYGFVAIGMSNTTQEFQAFLPLAAADGSRDPRLTIVDGAQGGQTAADWANPSCQCWSVLGNRLQQAGITDAQVAVVWLKLANRQPTGAWPVAANQLAADTEQVLRALQARFPNLTLAYLSSRIYAGYATTALNPEPYAYQGGFSVRTVIANQLNGALPFSGPGRVAPWVAWGPYLWADGLVPRTDGLTWACADFADDGTHPSAAGRLKVAHRLLSFLQTDPTAREWYLAAP